jgi:hydrogenase nickel incorporation protein HypB
MKKFVINNFMCATCGCVDTHHHHLGEDHTHHHGEKSIVEVEKDILYQNNLLAERNRGYFDAKNIFCINLVSSPGQEKQPSWKGHSLI